METGNIYQDNSVGSTYANQTNAVQNSSATQGTANSKQVKVSGKTIGNPKLSETAAKYYEQLKKKYNNMDFILVSEDAKDSAQASAAQYANANKMVVLIDTDKIEKMATDENYRKQYEGIISGATVQMAQMQTNMGSNAAYVKGYGMSVNDGGTASFFAVVDKSLAAQKERISEKTAEKKADKKAADKKAAEKAAEKKAADKLSNHKSDSDKVNDANKNEVTVTASSIEELMNKINDVIYASMSDHVMTDAEKLLGSQVDFSL